ncbi:regulator of chromosome condensation 1/beta-lactamase-inhibitor protein II [Trametes elegans]|nr:regulator of chromosome condensation 1/beta-lactamase-inhibitor protein II [Trametes elegans]
MALTTPDVNIPRNGRTKRQKRRASAPPPPGPKKRPSRKKADPEPPSKPKKRPAAPKKAAPSRAARGRSTTVTGGAQWLNPLPPVPTHERPGWQVFSWVPGDSGQLGMGADVLAVNLAKPRRNAYTEKLAESALGGGVWTCGMNDNAELGRTSVTITQGDITTEVDEATSLPFHVPVPITTLDGDHGFSPSVRNHFRSVPFVTRSGLQFSSVAAGDNHVLLLTTTGERHLIKDTLPERVILGSRSRKAVVVGTGTDHSFAVDEDGNTWGWGLNGHGQTGTGLGSERNEDRVVATPLRVHGMSKAELSGATVVQIAGGTQHTLFLTSVGRVYGCGNYEDGQIGFGDEAGELAKRYPGKCIPEPVRTPFPEEDDPVIAVACGTHNSIAVTRGGAMYAWGRDTTGQIGAGEGGADVRTPTAVVRRTGGSCSAKAASCGGQHWLALLQKKICRGRILVPPEDVRADDA